MEQNGLCSNEVSGHADKQKPERLGLCSDTNEAFSITIAGSCQDVSTLPALAVKRRISKGWSRRSSGCRSPDPKPRLRRLLCPGKGCNRLHPKGILAEVPRPLSARSTCASFFARPYYRFKSLLLDNCCVQKSSVACFRRRGDD